VLPLANLSHDPDQLYFVDGMHDEIISRLSKISGILVKNRASSLRYRDSSKPPAEIGRELGVDALISGSVSRANNRVAIRVQLVSAATEDNLWAETYQRDLTDVLGLQSEVAQAIVRAIGVTLNPGEQKTLASSRLVNPEAYEAYLRARRLLDTYWDESHYREAKRWSERAIELDPNFPNAYITLAGVYFNLGQIGVLKWGESLRLAEEQGARAYALDPTPEAEYAMVNPRGIRTFEWRKSMEVVERWIASDPNSASAHARLGSFYMLCFEDRADDAIAEYRKALELDPANVSYDESLGEAFLYGRRYAVALRHADGLASRHAETSEAANQAAWLRAMIYAATGDNARAIAEARKVAAAWPEQRSLVAPIYAKAGNTSEARQLIRLDEQKYKAGRPVDAANIALTYLYLGETDKVFGWLDRAFDDYDWGLVFLRNPLWDPVRKDPRFQQVVRRRFGAPAAK
jgi:TolB-like protein